MTKRKVYVFRSVARGIREIADDYLFHHLKIPLILISFRIL